MSDSATEITVPYDMDGLRQLYFTEFCPLYDYLCSKLESIPSELHFEISAAFDHLMRAGLEIDGRKYETENIAKASGHLKRATFDAFKLLYKYTTRPLWKKLTRSRYETVPGFVEDVQRKWIEATTAVEHARGLERISRGDAPDQWTEAFDEWKKLRGITQDLEDMFVSDRAKLARRRYARSWIAGVVAAIVSGVAVSYIVRLIDFILCRF